MKMSFVKRDGNGNAEGIRYVFTRSATVKDVHSTRAWYAKHGWEETRTTRKLSDKQALSLCREEK